MNLIAQTKYGPVEGFAEGGIRRWFGIPFAAPPVGERRFRRAQEPEPWTQARPCKAMGNSSVQFAAGPMADLLVMNAPASEDCLYLNVWAPEQAEGAPVFVYIYGGANHMGESAAPGHDLSAFARDGIVGVSFNYRLGALGFYDFSDLGEGFDSNCAVSDMIAALKWVHENIASFGGDPGNVTICGESAGGTGVYCLLASPAAQGYFQKAIPMSGLSGNATPHYVHALNNALFFEELGLTPAQAAETLKTMPVEELVRGGGAVMAKHNDAHQGIFLTGPVIDDLIPDYPWRMLAKGNAKDVALLVGTCRDEGGLFCMLGNSRRTGRTSRPACVWAAGWTIWTPSARSTAICRSPRPPWPGAPTVCSGWTPRAARWRRHGGTAYTPTASISSRPCAPRWASARPTPWTSRPGWTPTIPPPCPSTTARRWRYSRTSMRSCTARSRPLPAPAIPTTPPSGCTGSRLRTRRAAP